MKLNILIRTSNRPNQFKRLLNSIMSQTFKDIKIIVSVDNDETNDYVSAYSDVDIIVINEWKPRKHSKHNPYNLYCNTLLDAVEDRWVYFADDDNVIHDRNTFQYIMDNVKDESKLHVFKITNEKNGVTFPRKTFGESITINDIDTGNIVIHSSLAKQYKWKDVRAGDFYYINDVANGIGNENIEWFDRIILRMPDGADNGARHDIPAPIMTCNMCGYRGAFAAMLTRKNCICPRCRSFERHRFMWEIFRQTIDPKEIVRPIRLLHVAPEVSVRNKIKQFYGNRVEYVTSSYDGRGTDIRLDLTQMNLPDNSVDVIICSHVLEHVDDVKALHELRRVIRPNGKIFLMFPIKRGKTIEDPAYNTPELKRKHYGQEDHMRFYGYDDIADKFTNFTVESYNPFDHLSDDAINYIVNPTICDQLYVLSKEN